MKKMMNKKSKGMARGGRTAMKSKGYAKGGKMRSKGMAKGGAGSKLKMVKKNGKMVPFYAADGVGKMYGGGMAMKKKGMAKGGMKWPRARSVLRPSLHSSLTPCIP